MPVPVEDSKPQNIDAPLPQSPPEDNHHQEGSSSPVDGSNGSTHLHREKSKLFVGGLADSVDEDKLRETFKDFGVISECRVMRDLGSAASKKPSRGFGFVTFEGADCLSKVINSHALEPIKIDNKEIDPKEAVPQKKPSNKVKRIFVGGISSDSHEDDIKNHFQQFGTVLECQLMFDRQTSRHRGFAFVTFDNEEPAEKVCSIQYHDIKGKKVEVKVAQTKEALAMNGKGRSNNGRNGYSNNYVYPSTTAAYLHSHQNYYPHSPTYGPAEFMTMGGYHQPPYIYNGMRKPLRGGKSQDYTPQYPAYMYGGWPEPTRGYYGPPGYGNMSFMYRPGMEIIPTSGMDYVTDQFQGIALGGYPPSPMSQYPPPMSHSAGGGMAHVTEGSASASPPELSPTATSDSATTYNTQVPNFAGSTAATFNGAGNEGSSNY